MSSRRKQRRPTIPAEILREEFLVPLGMTQKQLADQLGCDVKVVNRLVNGRASVTAEMALKLGATFRTTPGFWLNAQKAVDLYVAAKRLENLPKPPPRRRRENWWRRTQRNRTGLLFELPRAELLQGTLQNRID